MKKKVIRVGMKVRSIYDHKRIFRIDKSIKPERVFREKGSKRWYLKSELRGARDAGPFSLNLMAAELKRFGKKRSVAFRGAKFQLSPKRTSEFKLTCDECGLQFTRERKPRPGHGIFCSGAHRTANWKRRNEIPEIPKDRLRSELAE